MEYGLDHCQKTQGSWASPYQKGLLSLSLSLPLFGAPERFCFTWSNNPIALFACIIYKGMWLNHFGSGKVDENLQNVLTWIGSTR